MGAVAEVRRSLAELWSERSDGERPVVRACAHNLVVVCEPDAGDVNATLARVAPSAPCRALVVRPSPRSGLSMYVSALCHRGPADSVVCSEQIVIEAGGDDLALVPGSILQLLVEELPVYVWWRQADFGDGELVAGLCELADCLIVDSARFGRPAEGLRRLRELGAAEDGCGRLADLGWSRLDPWREALAAFFDAPRLRERLEAIRRVTLTAGGPDGDGAFTTAAAYLVGWLASRLAWTPPGPGGGWRDARGAGLAVDLARDAALAPGEPGAVCLETAAGAGDAAGTVTFAVRRGGADGRSLTAAMEAPESCPLPRRIRLPERDEAAWLCEALQQPGRDPLFEAALAAAGA